jgi:hypothetical protein
MDAGELRLALLAHFAGFSERPDAQARFDLVLARGAERWGLALCADQPDALSYLGAFEAAMQQVIDARQLQQADLQLGIALGFASTAGGKEASYRRALKKYSNSIVFEDLDLSLFLVQDPQHLIVLRPAEVNAFLRDLNNWIAQRKL